MHISEMRRREDFDLILTETLARVWTKERGQQVEVHPAGDTELAQHWRFLPRHSAFVHLSAGAEVRRFLADSIRYTSRRWRRPLQFLGGTLLSTKLGIAMGSQPGFSVTPPLEHAESTFILPGNQRIRVFDLAKRRTRVYRKAGFGAELMAGEIALRRDGLGPFPPLTAFDDDGAWFEEAVVDGWCLARCPASVNPRSAIKEAFANLDAWTQDNALSLSAEEYLQELAGRVRRALALLVERFQHDISPWEHWLEVLIERGTSGPMRVGPTHGDCQDGNIMVRPGGGGLLIDWEHHARRWVHYDRMVFALRARYQAGLPQRILAFMRGQALEWHPEEAQARAWRERAIARFLLEDSVFQVEEAARGPYQRVTEGLCDRERGMELLGPGLADLWGA